MPFDCFLWPGTDKDPAPFDPSDVRRNGPATDTRYFAGVLDELGCIAGSCNHTILVTWHLDRFDTRFENAVVLLVGDEKYQTPTYIRRVRAVFKTGGTARNPWSSLRRLPPSIGWRLMAREARNIAEGVHRRLRRQRGARDCAPMFEMPLGRFRCVDVPHVPFEQRSTDVFFAGWLGEGRWSIRPSAEAREHMRRAIEAARRALPDVRFRISQPNGERMGAEEYASAMMDSRIALCPRGNFDETFRMCEAAKAGCVVISEPLPNRWYNADAPIVQIDRWSKLTGTLRTLLANPHRLSELSDQTRAWWARCMDEQAVAKYMHGQLKSLGVVS